MDALTWDLRRRRNGSPGLPSILGLLKSSRVSDILFVAYLVTQQVHLTGTQIDIWTCRTLFVMYATCAFLFDILPRQIRNCDPFFTRITTWAAIFYSFAIVSSLWSISITHSLDATYLNNILHILIIITFFSYQIGSKEDLDRAVLLVFAVIAITAAVLFIKTPSGAWGSERVGESIGLNSNSAGVMMAVGCLFILYLSTSYREKWLAVLVVPLFVIGLMSGSRKAFMLLLIFIAGYSILHSKGFKTFLVIAVALVFVYFAYNYVMTNPDLYAVIGQRIERAVMYVSGGATVDYSLIERAFYRRAAMEEFFQHPVLGIGMNGFLAYMENIGYSHVAYSHCNYTELLCNFGIIGFVSYYAIFASMLMYCVKNINKLDNKLSFALILLIGLLLADYGAVTYIDITQLVYVTLAWCVVNLHRRENAPAVCDRRLPNRD